MKSTTIEKDKILNYIIYAEFYVSQFSISIKRVPNITIDQEDLKSSILNIRNSIKKIKRFIERDKEIKAIEQIYSSSKKQFIYLIDLMDIHWKKDYIGIKNSFDRFNYEKKFSKIFDEKEQKEIIKKRNQSSGFLKTFIWRILISYNLILKSAEILNIQLRGINFDYIKINFKPILLVEGKTDKRILETAWKILNPGKDFPYLIFDTVDGHNAKDVKYKLENADSFQNEFVLGIFDFDEEGYNCWKGLKFNVLNDDKKIKKDANKNYYAILLPCTSDYFNHSLLKNQIFNQDKNSLKELTIFQIEHMFYDTIKEKDRKEYFLNESLYGGNITRFKDKKKQEFCEWICTNGIREDFKNFEVIFKIIEDCQENKI